MSACNTDTLVALVAGEIDEPLDVVEVLDHVDVCPRCEERLAVIVALRAGAVAA